MQLTLESDMTSITVTVTVKMSIGLGKVDGLNVTNLVAHASIRQLTNVHKFIFPLLSSLLKSLRSMAITVLSPSCSIMSFTDTLLHVYLI